MPYGVQPRPACFSCLRRGPGQADCYLALDTASDPPQAFDEIIKADTAKWAKVIKEANIKAE